MSEADLKAQLQLYAQDLLAYPLEAAVKAVRRWPDTNRFWPAWAELRTEVESITRSMESRRLLERQKTRRIMVPCYELALESDKCKCPECRAVRERGYI